MEGIIKIQDYKIHCIIGVYPEERVHSQEISIDLEMRISVDRVIKSDLVEDTVDYGKVALAIEKLALEHSFHLLETFACRALEAIFSHFPILWAKLTVKKKGALSLAQFVSFTMEKKA